MCNEVRRARSCSIRVLETGDHVCLLRGSAAAVARYPRRQSGRMSLETQAILTGHLLADEVAKLVIAAGMRAVSVRQMQRPEYWIVAFQRDDGSPGAINLFIDSWAAEDYADVFTGPGTLVTAEYSPDNSSLLQSMVSKTGGMFRSYDSEPWVEIAASLS